MFNPVGQFSHHQVGLNRNVFGKHFHTLRLIKGCGMGP